MATLNWTTEAQKWLHEIYKYIALDNPTAAVRVIEGIHDKAQLLTRYPRLGYRYIAIPEREIRILLYQHYRIANIVKKDDAIDILGVFHGALDMNRFLS